MLSNSSQYFAPTLFSQKLNSLGRENLLCRYQFVPRSDIPLPPHCSQQTWVWDLFLGGGPARGESRWKAGGGEIFFWDQAGGERIREGVSFLPVPPLTLSHTLTLPPNQWKPPHPHPHQPSYPWPLAFLTSTKGFSQSSWLDKELCAKQRWQYM